MSEARTAGVQPKREAKLLTVIGITTMPLVDLSRNLHCSNSRLLVGHEIKSCRSEIQNGRRSRHFENLFWTSHRKGNRKVQGVPQSQTAAFPRHQENEETDKTKQAQIKQMVRKALKFPASILRKSTSGRHRPVSYPDGPMTARYRFT